MLIASMALSDACADESYNQRFNEALVDSVPLAKEILSDWEQNGPRDGDYYAAQFNYYMNQGFTFGLCMSAYLPLYVAEMGMYLTDSVGNPAGYMFTGVTSMDSLLLDTAITWLQKGIELFPERLDLRIGLSSTYRMMEDGDNMYKITKQTVEYIMAHKNIAFTWTSDERLGENDKPIESTIHDYFSDCYYSEVWRDFADKFVNLGLLFAPDSEILLNDKAVLLLDAHDAKGALRILKKAHKINPKDEYIKENMNYIKRLLKTSKSEQIE